MIKILIFCVGLVSVPAVIAQSPPSIPVIQVTFEESEPGFYPYITRMLLSRRYLRIDDGQDDGDFVLFDRVFGNVHNINHEERTEVIIQRQPPSRAMHASIDIHIEPRPLLDAPKIGGIQAVQHRYYAGAELCRESINFDGLLPDFVEALAHYQQVLVQQSLLTLDDLPTSVKTPCYLVNNFFHASDYLRAGFPAMVADNDNKRRTLLEFGQLEIPASLLRRPQNYSRFFP